MNDLIRRQEAVEAIYQALRKPSNSELFMRISNAIKKLPSAQGWTPVRPGCWMSKEYEYGTNGEFDRWVERIAIEGDYAYCSLCGGGVLLDGGEDYVYSAYCPHCGAKMEEVKNE